MAKISSKVCKKRKRNMMTVKVHLEYELPFDDFFDWLEDTEEVIAKATTRAKREQAALDQMADYTNYEADGNVLATLGEWHLDVPDKWELEIIESK